MRKLIEVYDVGMLDYEYCEYICEGGDWCKVEEVRELEKYTKSLEEQIEDLIKTTCSDYGDVDNNRTLYERGMRNYPLSKAVIDALITLCDNWQMKEGE